MNASDVSAIVVTRGDVDLSPILDSLDQAGFDDVIVYDNSKLPDLAVYGRYAAIEHAEHPTILVQDDDCVLAPEAFEQLLAAYQPGHVVCNMPERFRVHYSDSALVGFGAIFDRRLVGQAFERFALHYGAKVPGDPGHPSVERGSFVRTCDVIFTALTPRVLVDAPYTDLPYASDPSRMWRQPAHIPERAQMLELARAVRFASEDAA